jgi:hypothetical protein
MEAEIVRGSYNSPRAVLERLKACYGDWVHHKDAAEVERERDGLRLENSRLRSERDHARGKASALEEGVTELHARIAQLESERGTLLAHCPYPWCPECQEECRSVDEDHLCVACGVDVVWPSAEHVRERDELYTQMVAAGILPTPEPPEVTAAVETAERLADKIERDHARGKA